MHLKLRKKEVVPRKTIYNKLTHARNTYSYCKFSIWSDEYISVIFNRDRTIEIATNTRDLQLIRNIRSVKSGFTISRVSDFIFNFINTKNK